MLVISITQPWLAEPGELDMVVTIRIVLVKAVHGLDRLNLELLRLLRGCVGNWGLLDVFQGAWGATEGSGNSITELAIR